MRVRTILFSFVAAGGLAAFVICDICEPPRALALASSFARTHEARRAAAEDTVTLRVGGMTCEGCAIGVRMVLKRLEGVKQVQVSLESGLATVTHDPAKVSVEEMVAAIKQIGFVATALGDGESTEVGASRALALPAGLQRVSLRVEGLYEASRLAEVREALKSLGGVHDAGTHQRAPGEKVGIAWAIYDPTKVNTEQILDAVRRLGYTVVETGAKGESSQAKPE